MLPTLVDPGHQPVDIGPDDHVLISVVRNETLRLPYLLRYYRALGIDRFLLIDNDSSDGTREFLRDQPDVALFHTTDCFSGSHCGVKWATPILDSCCQGHWVLYVDGDELLVWPGSEHESIQDLTSRLDKVQAGGLFVTLLDMYSDKPFGSVGYVQGEPFLRATPFFDSGPYGLRPHWMFPYRHLYGGPRARTFPYLEVGKCNPPIASKVPLTRWHQGQEFGGGCHALVAPVAFAPMRGALLHFKMFDDIPRRCKEEVVRGEHWAGGREYLALGEAIEHAPNHSFFDPQYSVRYEGTKQLVSLGIMDIHDPFGAVMEWTGPVTPM